MAKIYQPEIDINGNVLGHEYDSFFSFQVWRSLENMLKRFPECVPVEYEEGDIEDPTYMD